MKNAFILPTEPGLEITETEIKMRYILIITPWIRKKTYTRQ